MATQFVQLLADGMIVPVVLLAAYALLFRVPKGRRLQMYSRILMAGLTAYLVAKIVGSLYQPTDQRPFEILGIDAGASYLDNPGFPSDHALFAMFLALAVWFATRWRLGAVIMLSLTLLICVGRVLALVHTPLDVIGGVLIACTGVVWYFDIFTTTITRKKHKNRVQ